MSKVKEFSYTKKMAGDQAQFAVNEAIDERFDVPLSEFTGAKSAVVDFSNVNWINSLGIRKFSRWVWEMEDKMPQLKISLVRLPPVVVRQLNLIRSQFGKNMEVNSVFVPFYCDNCDLDDKSVLVTREQLAGNDPIESKIPPKACPKCGKLMEMDVVENYFAIIKD
jgi:hypothetical protein